MPYELAYSPRNVQPGPSFAAPFWQANVAGQAQASVVCVDKSIASNSLTLTAQFYTKGDTASLLWDSQDVRSHPLCAYLTKTNYLTDTLTLQWSQTGAMPALGPGVVSLVVDGYDINSVPRRWTLDLWSFVQGGATATTATFVIPFTKWTAASLWDAVNWDQFQWDGLAGALYSGNITRLSIVVTPVGYVAGSTTALAGGPQAGAVTLAISDFSPTIPMLTAQGSAADHDLRAVIDYESTWFLSPDRVIGELAALGYGGPVEVSAGNSRFPTLAFSGGSWVIAASPALNAAATAWFTRAFELLEQNGMYPLVSRSFECGANVLPTGWAQAESGGTPATTLSGSVVLAPTVPAVQTHIAGVLEAMLALVPPSSPLQAVIGRPQWFYNADLAPTIYDATTTALYYAQTGQSAPAIATINVAPNAQQSAYLTWLAGKVAAAATGIRASVLGAFSTAAVGVRLDVATIEATALTTAMNVSTALDSPAFDFLQVQDFAWVTPVISNSHGQTITLVETLGYPLAVTDYIAGFAVWAADWNAVQSVLDEAMQTIGYRNGYAWSFTNVARSGYVFTPGPSTSTTSVQFTFTDELGNPFPPGVLVQAQTPGGILVASAYTQIGGIATTTLPAGAYVLSFLGRYAPASTLSVTLALNETAVALAVTGYRSPFSTLGTYVLVQSLLWPKRWFGEQARAVGGNAYNVANGLAGALSAMDSQAQSLLAMQRGYTAQGVDLYSWAQQFLGPNFVPLPGEPDAIFRARAFATLQVGKITLSAISSLIGTYFSALVASNNAAGLSYDDGNGSFDSGQGGYNDASIAGGLVPDVYVWDAQSQPALATLLGIAPPQLVVQTTFAVPSGYGFFLDQTAFLDSTGCLIDETAEQLSQTAQLPAVGELVATSKAAGTEPMFGLAFHF